MSYPPIGCRKTPHSFPAARLGARLQQIVYWITPDRTGNLDGNGCVITVEF